MNNKIEALHQNLISLLNDCELPIGVAFYIYKDVLSELDKLYANAIQQEQKEEKKETE